MHTGDKWKDGNEAKFTNFKSVTEIGNAPSPPNPSANHASTSPMAYPQQMVQDVVSGEQYRYALTNFVSSRYATSTTTAK